MICANCNTLNVNTDKFCTKCGQPLISITPLPSTSMSTSTSVAPAIPTIQVSRQELVSVAKNVSSGIGAIVGSLIGIGGGAAIIIGWLLPWVNLGSTISDIIGLVNLFGGLSAAGGLGGLGGLSNGPQIGLGLITIGFAMLSQSQTAVVGFLALILALIVFVLPLVGIGLVRSGVKILERRTESGQRANTEIGLRLKDMRSQASTIFIILAIIFVAFAALPFGVSILGTGFLTMLGASVGVFFGALFARSLLGSSSSGPSVGLG